MAKNDQQMALADPLTSTRFSPLPPSCAFDDASAISGAQNAGSGHLGVAVGVVILELLLPNSTSEAISPCERQQSLASPSRPPFGEVV